jgi:hypothetical protein
VTNASRTPPKTAKPTREVQKPGAIRIRNQFLHEMQQTICTLTIRRTREPDGWAGATLARFVPHGLDQNGL